MEMTEKEFSTIQKLLKENGDILTLESDPTVNAGNSNGLCIYSLSIKHNLYVDSVNPHIRTTDDFVRMIRSVLKDYKVSFNSTRSMFWLNPLED